MTHQLLEHLGASTCCDVLFYWSKSFILFFHPSIC